MSLERMTFVETYVSNRKKSGIIAYALWAFLGAFGAHRFYIGKVFSGIIMLLVTLIFSWWTFGIITGIWLFIDAFLIWRWLRQDKERLTQEAMTMTKLSEHKTS